MSTYNIVSSDNDATVVAEYAAEYCSGKDYQSEAQLEQDFVKRLCQQGYEFTIVKNEDEMNANLRHQLETFNNYIFTDLEWARVAEIEKGSENEGT